MSTKIAWCNETWNPIKGCTPISAGCQNCYASTMAKRLAGMGVKGYSKRKPFAVTFQQHVLDKPYRWRKPRLVFVCSMGDILHEKVHGWWIDSVWNVIRDCPRHTFLVLTKRPARMYNQFRSRKCPPNVWLGVTVESQRVDDETARLGWLAKIAEHFTDRTFVSYEPALGPIDWTRHLSYIGWLICGAESGPGARPFDDAWAIQARDQCKAAGVPFFLKQRAKGAGPFGKWPKDLQVRDYPDF